MGSNGLALGNIGYARAQAAPRNTVLQLGAEALAQLQKLKARDLEVHQHEQAHLAAAGGLALSGANYSFQRGPDGVDYAVGGEVQIDMAPGANPEDTLARARTISAAALAPAEPSGADRAVAAQARQMAMQARAELAAQGGADGPGTPQQRALRQAYATEPAPPSAVDVYA